MRLRLRCECGNEIVLTDAQCRQLIARLESDATFDADELGLDPEDDDA